MLRLGGRISLPALLIVTVFPSLGAVVIAPTYDFAVLQIELRQTPPRAEGSQAASGEETAPPAASQPSDQVEPSASTVPVAIKQVVPVGGPFFSETQIDGKVLALKGQVEKTTAGFQTDISVRLSEPVVMGGQQVPAQAAQGFSSGFILRMGEWTKAGEVSGSDASRAWFVRLTEPTEEMAP
jgi:hypothetical protein